MVGIRPANDSLNGAGWWMANSEGLFAREIKSFPATLIKAMSTKRETLRAFSGRADSLVLICDHKMEMSAWREKMVTPLPAAEDQFIETKYMLFVVTVAFDTETPQFADVMNSKVFT